MRQRRRQATLITQGFRSSGEVGISLGRDPAESVAVVAGDAIKRGERFVDHLVVSESVRVYLRQCCCDELRLLGTPSEARCSIRFCFCHAAFRRIETGHCSHGSIVFTRKGNVVMTLCTTEAGEVQLSLCRQNGITLQWTQHRNLLIGSGEHVRWNRLSGKPWPFHLKLQDRLATGVKIRQLDRIPPGLQLRLRLKRLGSAMIARCQIDYGLAIHAQAAAIQCHVKRVIARSVDAQKPIVTDCRVVVHIAKLLQIEIIDLSCSLLFNITLQAFPNLSSPLGECKVTGHSGVSQQIVRDVVELVPGQSEIRHATRWTHGMRPLQKFPQALVRILFFQSTERHRCFSEQLHAGRISGGMAGHTANRMKQPLAPLRRHGIRHLKLELLAIIQGYQKMGNCLGYLQPFCLTSIAHYIRHQRSRFHFMRSRDKRPQVVRVHPRPYRCQPRSFARRVADTLRIVTGHTVQFFDEHSPLKFGRESAICDSRHDEFGRNGAAGESSSDDDVKMVQKSQDGNGIECEDLEKLRSELQDWRGHGFPSRPDSIP
jgi:hypothetical protein